jgi:cytosine/adenosine deaminase-related metal-dependent hydrolase
VEDNQIKVLHCPSANLKLGSGIAPIPEYLKRGISVSLGADGAPCNNNLSMFNEMRLAAFIQKPIHGPTSMDAETVFRMATIDGAKALGINDRTGSIETGKLADLAFCKINQIDTIPFENIYSKVVYSTNSSGIDHLIIDGEWIVQNRQPVNYDIDTIIQDANKQIESFKTSSSKRSI